MEPKEEACPPEDHILDFAIEYKQSGTYPPALTKEKKRAVRKRTASLIADNGEIYVERKNRRVKVVTSAEEQARILRACHSDLDILGQRRRGERLQRGSIGEECLAK